MAKTEKTTEKPEVAEPTQVEPQAPEASILEQILALTRGLTAADRVELMRAGISVPRVMPGDNVTRWGYLCRHCTKIGLVFVGSDFALYDGTTVEEVPVGVRFGDLPWTQPARNEVPTSRDYPKCQHCEQGLDHDDGFPKRKRIVEMAAWRASRDRAMDIAKRFKAPPVDLPEGIKDEPANSFDDPAHVAERGKLSKMADETGLGAKAFAKTK